MLGESQKFSTCTDSQICKQDFEIFLPKSSCQLYLLEIQNNNEENDHKSAQVIRQVLFNILIFFDEVICGHK